MRYKSEHTGQEIDAGVREAFKVEALSVKVEELKNKIVVEVDETSAEAFSIANPDIIVFFPEV